MADARPETTGRKPQELSSGERLLPPKEAANFLRLSPSWLAKARMRGTAHRMRSSAAPFAIARPLCSSG